VQFTARARGVCLVFSAVVLVSALSCCCTVVRLYCFKKIEVSHKFLTIDDEKLIECVRKYPAIYDMSHSKYLDNNHKSSLWKKITEEMKEDGT
jgi:hypothetical protein